MIEFVSLKNYQTLYLNLTLVIVLFTMVHTLIVDIEDRKNIIYIRTVGTLILVFLMIYMGLRPVSGRYFLDMITYARHFERYEMGGEVISNKDVVFHYFMKFSSNFLSVNYFFLLCAILYIYPMYKISIKFFKEYWFYSFLMFIVSFSFWTYGVNGIRNGVATSIFLWGLAYQDNRKKMIGLCLIAVLFHKTLLLPIFAYILTFFYNKPKTYLICWLLAIPLSIAFGGVWESLFAALGFGDESRLGGYLSGSSEEGNGGFRYDFLFHSAFAVFAGWYFIFKKNYKDKIYIQLFNTYLIANAFWVLVIRASFSNRFAYLSWFLMAIIIIYPLLKEKMFTNQHLVLGRVVFLYFSFTYLMYTVYY
mgnify:CR=1 FL=1|tara:strand:- start:56719 stop:57807 length:1089 start_codon:yes stop_codon:yes gene_type:complete